MDLSAAEQLRSRKLIKRSAVVCFVLAGALLVVSLFLPPPAQVRGDNGGGSGFAASGR